MLKVYFGGLINIYLVLVGFRESLLAQNQSKRFATSVFAVFTDLMG